MKEKTSDPEISKKENPSGNYEMILQPRVIECLIMWKFK